MTRVTRLIPEKHTLKRFFIEQLIEKMFVVNTDDHELVKRFVEENKPDDSKYLLSMGSSL